MSGLPVITPVHTALAVSATSIELAAANSLRTYLMIQNVSDKVAYLGLGEAAVNGEGMRINTSGLTDELVFAPHLGNLFLGQINVICSSGASDLLLITEGSGVVGYPPRTMTKSQASIAVTSTLLIAANANRKYLYLHNQDGSDHVFIKFGAAAVVDEGIRLKSSNLERFEISPQRGNLFTGAIYGIHGGAGTAPVNVVEGT